MFQTEFVEKIKGKFYVQLFSKFVRKRLNFTLYLHGLACF